MVATPGDGSCGIGTYAADVLASLEGVDATAVYVDQDDRSAREVASLAFRAIRAPGEVVHVQHEYGLFRRDGSRYPGVMGLVFFPLLFLLNAIRGKAVVVTLHSVLNPTVAEAPLAVRLYLRVMHVLLAAGTDHLIFLSPDCERRFLEDVPLDPDAYSLLPHGVNATKAVDVDPADARARFGLDPDATVVMIPGFIRPPKGHDLFVEVAGDLPEYEFLIAGGARPKGADFAFATEVAGAAPDNVTVTGVLEDEETFATALATADLAFLPYRVVTQSGTFNWCAAQELPVLASDEPYFARLRREWDVVETVPLGDHDELVARVRALVDDEDRRAELVENVRGYKRANSFERVAEEHARIYRRVRDVSPADVPAEDRATEERPVPEDPRRERVPSPSTD